MGLLVCSVPSNDHSVGLSSSTVNVLWGGFNLAVGYVLVCRVGEVLGVLESLEARPEP